MWCWQNQPIPPGALRGDSRASCLLTASSFLCSPQGTHPRPVSGPCHPPWAPRRGPSPCTSAPCLLLWTPLPSSAPRPAASSTSGRRGGEWGSDAGHRGGVLRPPKEAGGSMGMAQAWVLSPACAGKEVFGLSEVRMDGSAMGTSLPTSANQRRWWPLWHHAENRPGGVPGDALEPPQCLQPSLSPFAACPATSPSCTPSTSAS